MSYKLIAWDQFQLFWDKLKTQLSALSGRIDTIVAEGGEPNVIEVVQKNGTALTVTNKTVDVTVPTTVAELTDESDYATKQYVTTEIAGITGVSFEIVQTLPATGDAGTIYLVSHGGTGTNIYDEYIYTNSAWEKIGTTDIDLSGYVQTSDITLVTNAEINELFED